MIQAAREFSRFAKMYNRHNIIQAEVAKRLVSLLPDSRYDSILDIGCGRGEVYRNLNAQGIVFDHLTVMDISREMLDLHPADEKLIPVQGDFNRPEFIDTLPRHRYDILISSSALQWSSDLDRSLRMLQPLAPKHYFAIFTSGTFQTLHSHAGIRSPIYSEGFLREKIAEHFAAEFETVRYKLHFDTVYAMLRYIKESGTSGGERRLSYRETKRLLDSYPLDYLEFEVLFVRAAERK